jgi:uncharacterized protein (TIGR04255 family)
VSQQSQRPHRFAAAIFLAVTRPPDLPDFDAPPVIEVVVGVQFPTIEQLCTAHVGAFWQRIRSDYPSVQDAPPLAAVYESPREGLSSLEVSLLPLRRSYFVSGDGAWLAQLQGNRLLHNWRKQSDTDSYPRYEACLDRFQTVWRAFRKFLAEENLPLPTPDQLELTYVNHIPLDRPISSLADIGEVFPDIKWQTSRSFLPTPSGLRWSLNFELPNQTGRLHVDVKTAVRAKDSVPLLVCELTTRGAPTSPDDDALAAWFGQGREWIVKGFADLTGQTVQRDVWQRVT